MTQLFNHFFIACDAPRPWGIYFQDSASPQMEALVELHDNIMFYLVILLFGVAWTLISIIRYYVNDKSPISNQYLNVVAIIWLIFTITPALILIVIEFPSFKLLYSTDEVSDPSFKVILQRHEWYWSYQYPDFWNDAELEFDNCIGYKAVGSNGSTNVLTPAQQQELIELEQARVQSNCIHSSMFPYPSDGPNPIKCDLNPTTQGVQHEAFRDGVSPTVCSHCFLVICRDCSNPDYDSE